MANQKGLLTWSGVRIVLSSKFDSIYLLTSTTRTFQKKPTSVLTASSKCTARPSSCRSFESKLWNANFRRTGHEICLQKWRGDSISTWTRITRNRNGLQVMVSVALPMRNLEYNFYTTHLNTFEIRVGLWHDIEYLSVEKHGRNLCCSHKKYVHNYAWNISPASTSAEGTMRTHLAESLWDSWATIHTDTHDEGESLMPCLQKLCVDEGSGNPEVSRSMWLINNCTPLEN